MAEPLLKIASKKIAGSVFELKPSEDQPGRPPGVLCRALLFELLQTRIPTSAYTNRPIPSFIPIALLSIIGITLSGRSGSDADFGRYQLGGFPQISKI